MFLRAQFESLIMAITFKLRPCHRLWSCKIQITQ